MSNACSTLPLSVPCATAFFKYYVLHFQRFQYYRFHVLHFKGFNTTDSICSIHVPFSFSQKMLLVLLSSCETSSSTAAGASSSAEGITKQLMSNKLILCTSHADTIDSVPLLHTLFRVRTGLASSTYKYCQTQ